MFADKAKSLQEREAPERCFTQVGSGITCKCKHKTKQVRPVRNKHCNLLEPFVNCDNKMFRNIGPWFQCFKTFLSSLQTECRIKLERLCLLIILSEIRLFD
jgi:hypothetical protein